VKKYIVFASITVIFLLVTIWHDQTKLDHMAVEIESLKTKQAGVPRPISLAPAKADLDMQTKCAAQAKVFFNQWLRENPQYREPDVSNTFSDHYDPATSGCYVEIVESGKRVGSEFSVSKYVSDAYESSALADYFWVSRTGHSDWEVKPVICNVKGHDGKDNHCESDDDFKQMVHDTYGVNE